MIPIRKITFEINLIRILQVDKYNINGIFKILTYIVNSKN